MLNNAVSGDILKKDFRLMTQAKVFHRDSKGRGFELPHQGVSSVGERGHRLTERRPPFLGEGQALAVKDANPREFARRRLGISHIMRWRQAIAQAAFCRWNQP
jgi:hypothetical protein